MDPDWAILSDLDAILVLCGDAAGEEEAVKKSTAFQVREFALSSTTFVLRRLTYAFTFTATVSFGCTQTWLLGYEFPSTILVIQKNQVTFVSSATKSTIRLSTVSCLSVARGADSTGFLDDDSQDPTAA